MNWEQYTIKPFNEDVTDEHCKYHTGLFYEGEEIPVFADMVLSDENLTNRAKKKFIKNVLNPYLNDEIFRNSVKNFYILFLNKKYYGLIENFEQLKLIGSKSDNKYVIQISDNEDFKFEKHLIDSTQSLDKHDSLYFNSFVSKCMLTNVPFFTPGVDISFGSTMIIDTGCSCTDMLNFDHWDFKNELFVAYPINIPIYKRGTTNISKILDFNKNKNFILKNKIKTSNGYIYENKVYFDPPLFLTVGTLDPVLMSSLMIPLKYPEKKTFLLGLDFICQIKLKIYTINNIPFLELDNNSDDNESF